MRKAKGYSGEMGQLTPLFDSKGNPKYSSGWLWERIPLFDYTADPRNPLIYTDSLGNQYMPDNHFEQDGGSIPLICQMIPFAHLNPFNFPRAYTFHDSCYQYAGLYIKLVGEETFKFRLMTRKQSDEMMCDWLDCDDADWWTRRVVCTGLAGFSRFVWDDTKKPIKQREERRLHRIDVYDMKGNLIEWNNYDRVLTI